jgi:PAS domain S-box-containing protein
MKERQFSVVIADAAPEDRAALRDALSRDPTAPYVVIEAESGLHALDLCRTQKPGCLILDHDLPDLSGLDVLKKLAGEEGAPACAVVVLVDAGEAQLAVEVMKSGAHDCLDKGRARGAELRSAVRQAIEKAERRRLVAATEHELIKKNRAPEADLAALRREAAGRGQGEEAWRVARAGAVANGAVVSPPEGPIHSQTEEQLRLLKTAIEQSNESVVIMTAQLDPPGPQIVFVSPAFTKMTGYSPEEVIGKTPHILEGHETDRSVLRRLCKDCMEGRVFHGETINYRKDHSEFHLEWTAGPVRNERGEVTHFAAALLNVTERRRVEDELRTSEEEFRSLFDLSAIGMTQVSPEGRYLRVNRKLCQMLGYSEQELLHLTLHEVTHPDDREVSAAKLSSSFADGAEEYSIEKRYMRKDGAIIWVLINWTVVRDAEGRSLRTVANIQDITERKRAETALRESQALNQAVLGSLAAHIAVLDRDGKIIAVNDAWKRFARENGGAAVADGASVNYLDVCRRASDRGDGEAWAALNGIQAVLDGERPVFTVEYPCHSPDEKRWFLMSVTPLLGAGGGAVVAHTDITQRKQIEESLRVSEERLDLAQKAGNIGTFDWDIRANKAVWTEQLKALFGLPPDGSGDTYERWLERVLPEDRPACEAGMREILEKRLPKWRSEYRIVRADTGEVRWIDSKGRVFYDELGEPLRFIGTATDITERKQAEAEREELLIREQSAREAAEALTRAKDEFLAIVSHELRSPLNAVLGYASLLRYGGLDAQKIRHAADVIERSGKAQAQLIDDLLDTARIISGKLRLELGPLDLVSVIEQAVQTIRPAADAKRISFETDIPSEIGQITGDPVRLQQVIWNLLSNAVKFTPQGGRVGVRLERIDPHICVVVSDTGKGISPDFLPYVFDRFRQADASSARRYGGLGLGLSLVKYLVELHGGTIEAASAGEGQGTTFKVMLPVRAVATPLGEAGGASDKVKSSGELAGMRALVVDDEDDARELLEAVLTQYGADVVAAGSAAEAYELIATAPIGEWPDVMVTDIGMPGEDGYSLIRRVRDWERERGAYIPAVALTAYGRSEDRMRALRAGFQMHVAKPVDPAELAIVITSLIRRPNSDKKHNQVMREITHS